MSFSAVDIIITKEEEIFGPKILMMVTTISCFNDDDHHNENNQVKVQIKINPTGFVWYDKKEKIVLPQN